MDNPIKGILIDTENNQIKTVVIKNELHSYYKALNCTAIDIVRRPVEGRMYTFVIDDEGRLKERVIPSCISMRGLELAGNVLIFNDNKLGDDQASLNNKDIELILRNTITLEKIDDEDLKGRKVLVLS